MSEQPFKATWATGSEFHEVAEALGVPTDHIVGGTRLPGSDVHGYLVLFSYEFAPEEQYADMLDRMDATEVHRAVLVRDEDDIYRVAGEVELVPDYFREARKKIDEKMTERFGPPTDAS